MTPSDFQREQDERAQALIAWLEQERVDRLGAIERAEAVLYEANLRDFRETMTALFEAHPALETVRFDQTSQYNDEYVSLDVHDLWINGVYVRTYAGLVYGNKMRRGPAYDDLEREEVETLQFHRPGALDDYGYPLDYRNIGRESGSTEAEILALAQNELGEVYDLAYAVYSELRRLIARYGAHFFWDLFGAVASVTVDRTSIHVIEDVFDGDAYREKSPDQDLEWVRDRLGPITEAYLTSPERQGAAGLRAAYTAELADLGWRLLWSRLRQAADAISRETGVRGYRLDVRRSNTSQGRIESVTVHGHTIPVWDRAIGYIEPHVLLPVLGVRDRYANRPAVTPEECEAALRENVPPQIADAILKWLAAIDEVRADYGPRIVRRLAGRPVQL